MASPPPGLRMPEAYTRMPEPSGIEFEDVGAILLFGRRIGIVDIGCGTHGDKHLFAIRSELQVASPVAFGSRQIRDVLCRTTRLQASAAIGKSQHSVLITDVDKLRVFTGGIEGDPVGPVETFREGF